VKRASPPGTAPCGPRSLADAVLPALLFAAAVVYLASLPTNLSPADESSYLYEAKRLLDGEVMYRDVFDFVTPGFQYLMALLFGLFGATITTARVAAAVIHGLTAVALYAACRRLGARPWLAAAAAVAHLTIDQSAWPIASQHWLSTLLCTLLLAAYAGGGVDTPGQAALGGVLLGMLAVVQQQRALPMAVGTAAWLVADGFLAPVQGGKARAHATAARLAVLAGSIAAVAAPVLAWCVVRAGFRTVWQALVEFPLHSYGATTHCEWGHVNIMTAWQGSFTFPRVLTWLPLGLVATIPRLARAKFVRRDEATARRLTWPVVFAATSAVSIRYFPDFIHIAFIAPVFYAILAENLEAAAMALGTRLGRVLTAGVVVAVLAVSSVRLELNRARLWTEFPLGVDTAFGRVQLRTAKDLGLYEEVRRLADATPGVELFVYPAFSHLYLMTGARNPTRYSWYASTFGFADILEALDAHRPPYALVMADWKPDDPIVAYVRRAYAPTTPDAPLVGTILRRRHQVGRSVGKPHWLKLLNAFSREGPVALPYCTVDTDHRLVRHPAEAYPAWPLHRSSAAIAFLKWQWTSRSSESRLAQDEEATRLVVAERWRTSAGRAASGSRWSFSTCSRAGRRC
jgi:hypothetical protein